MRYVLLLAVLVTLVACTLAADYQWGEPGPKDYLIARDKVRKYFFVGLRVSKTYIFKQKKIDALTISCIRINDRKDKYDSIAEIVNGGIGSKGVTIDFKSQRGDGIFSDVDIWGRY